MFRKQERDDLARVKSPMQRGNKIPKLDGSHTAYKRLSQAEDTVCVRTYKSHTV
jgi:hypothetical protein